MENPTPPTLPVLTYDRYDAAKDRRGFLRVILGFWMGIFVACLLNTIVYSTLTYLAPQFIGYDLIVVLIISLGIMILTPLFSLLTLPLSLYFQRRIKKEVRFASLLPAMLWGFAFALPFPSLRFLNLLDNAPLWLALFLFFGWLLLFPILPSFWLCYRSHLRD